MVPHLCLGRIPKLAKLALVAAAVAVGAAARAAEAFHRPIEGDHIGIDLKTPSRVPTVPTGDFFGGGGYDLPKRSHKKERFRSLLVRDVSLHIARGGESVRSDMATSMPMQHRGEAFPADGDGSSGATSGITTATSSSTAAAAAAVNGTGKRSDGLHGRLAEIATRVDAMEGMLNETMKGVDIVLNVISTILYSLAITCLLHWLFRGL